MSSSFPGSSAPRRPRGRNEAAGDAARRAVRKARTSADNLSGRQVCPSCTKRQRQPGGFANCDGCGELNPGRPVHLQAVLQVVVQDGGESTDRDLIRIDETCRADEAAGILISALGRAISVQRSEVIRPKMAS